MTVAPCFFRLSWPAMSWSNCRFRPKRRDAASSTSTATAMVSGPMPSPGSTTIFMGAFSCGLMGRAYSTWTPVACTRF
ncbi:hypothetical protein D3C81_2251330 [compost metagenome]